MSDANKIREEVRRLPGYGEHITGLTEAGRRVMPKLVFNALRQELGLFGTIDILFKALRRSSKLKRQYPEVHQRAIQMSPKSGREFPMFAGLFLVIAEKLGSRERAYEIFKRIIQESATVMMPDLYDVDRLEKFEDPYEAFKEYNFGMFDGCPNFPIDEFIDEGDHFHFRIVKCAQADIATGFGVSELGQLGCDHDLAGFPLIRDRVQAEFRRPETIAKGGQYCDFNFYRKGCAPAGSYENK